MLAWPDRSVRKDRLDPQVPRSIPVSPDQQARRERLAHKA